MDSFNELERIMAEMEEINRAESNEYDELAREISSTKR